MRTPLGILVCLLLVLGPAAADEKRLSSGEAADRAIQAFKAGDEAALKALAEIDDPDPWVVADALWTRGDLETARAFARASPRPATAQLGRYVESQRERKPDPKHGALLVEAAEALQGGKNDQVLALIPASVRPTDVATIRLAYVRAIALEATRRMRDAIAASVAVAKGAQRIGWWAYEARAWYLAGLIGLDTGDWEGTATWFGHSLRAYERGGNAPRALDARNALGVALKNLGRYEEAFGHYTKVLDAATAAGDRPGQADVLNNIAVVHAETGSYAKALENYERSLAIERQLGRRDGVSAALTNMANVYTDLAEYAKAVALLEEALQLDEEGGDTRNMAITLNSLGGVYRSLGRLREARAAYDRALAVRRDRKHWNGVASTLLNLGHLLDDLGDHEAAILRYREALQVLEDHPDARLDINAEQSLAMTLAETGKPDEALVHLDKALEAARALADRQSLPPILLNRGVLQYEAGRLREAEKDIREALDKARDLGRGEWEMRALWALAMVALERGNPARAVAFARQAADRATALLGGLGQQEAASSRDRRVGMFDVGLRAALAARSLEDLLYFLESGRAGALVEALRARTTLRESMLPPELRAAEARAQRKLAAAHRRYRKAMAAQSLKEIRARKREWDAARGEAEKVIQRIQRRAGAAADLTYPAPATIQGIQGLLRPGDALVLYALTSRSAVALVVGRAAVRMHDLGPASEITALAAALDAGNKELDPAEAVAALRARVIEPLGLGKATRRVLISPAGALAGVPFTLLAPDLDVLYVPSGTTLSLLAERPALEGTKVLALADPDYVTERAAFPGRGRGIVPLPGTRAEAKAVGDVLLLGADATMANLKAALSKEKAWRAVHLACHGFVDAERPLFSALALTPTDDDDGLFSVLEVFRTTLPADLVVLSACHTARGRQYRAEGIFGLTRAFMFAGARGVLCSLWAVDDEATQALMIKFYELWNPRAKPGDPESVEGSKGKGLAAAAALKNAQAFIRSHEKWKHPNYWAAWVLWGLPD